MTVPMSDDPQRKYTTAISKGAGMTEETRRLLEEELIDVFAR